MTAAGNITQVANTTLIVGGDASFTATNGAITLTQANAFTGNVVLSNTGTSNVTLTKNGALSLAGQRRRQHPVIPRGHEHREHHSGC